MELQWEKEEIKTLFKFVEIKKSEGVPLVKIFDQFATFVKRHKNSVRNYYYKLANLPSAELNELGIDKNCHTVGKAEPFTPESEQKLVLEIDNLIKNYGYSVRKACLELSGGDAGKMIRYQNKYRSLRAVKNNKDREQNMGEIIKMPVQNLGISDDEIKALFMGLLKLVKKQESQKAESVYAGKILNANEKLKRAMAEIAIKENEILKLQSQLELVENKVQEQKLEIENGKIKKVNSLAGDMLKKYFNDTENQVESKSN